MLRGYKCCSVVYFNKPYSRSFLINCVSIKFFSTLPTATYFHCTSFAKNHLTACTPKLPLRDLHFLRPFNEAVIAAHTLIFGIF